MYQYNSRGKLSVCWSTGAPMTVNFMYSKYIISISQVFIGIDKQVSRVKINSCKQTVPTKNTTKDSYKNHIKIQYLKKALNNV